MLQKDDSKLLNIIRRRMNPFTLSLFHYTKLSIITILLALITIHQTHSFSLCTTTQSNCLICPIECTKCDSNLQCTACSLQYYLSNNKCLPCPSFCLSCTSQTICVQCMDPYVLSSGTCNQCVISRALTCITTVSASQCQAQFYVNSQLCSSCLLNCKTCTSSSTCTQCIDSFYLNSTVLTCNPCPSNCLTCNQFTPTICNSCKSGYLLNASNKTCNMIDCSGVSNCVYCSGNNLCGRCQMFYYWNGTSCVMGASVLCEEGAMGVLPSSCVNGCGSFGYRVGQNGSGFLCVPYRTVKRSQSKMFQVYLNGYADVSDFQECSGLSSISQVESTGEYSFQTNQLNLGSIQSFYKIQIRMKYISVAQQTMRMTSQSQGSSQTQVQTLTMPLSPTPFSILYTTRSVHSNNLKIIFSSSIRVIQFFMRIYRCPQTCLQCLNTQLCELCRQPNYMLGYNCVSNCTVYYHFPLNRTCLLNCPKGYFYLNSGLNNKHCQACNSPCNQCIDATKCLTCITGYYFFNYTCIISCPDQYFNNPTNNTCDNCISPCKTCTTRSNCLTCSQGFWNSTKCTTLCNPGSFGNNLTRQCDPCDSQCLTCTNTSASCSSCINTLHLHNRRCISQCPERFYSNGVAPLNCISCKPPCESCTSQTSCITCAYNFLSGTQCIADCPEGYFENLVNNTCVQCSASCKSCSSANYCDSCPSSKCLSQGQCLTSCPSAAWYQLINSSSNECKCQECKYPCKQCLSATSCLSCLQGYLKDTSCLTQCPTTFHKNDTLKACISCATTFINCKQCTQLRCTLCNTGFLLHSGGCLSSCPQFFYQLNEKCSRCIAPCLQCSGFNLCKSCINGYLLYQSQCIVNCPAGKYSYSNVINSVTVTQCGTCQSPCMYCVDTASKCTFCQSSYYLYDNVCYKNCSTLIPSSTFYNEPVTSTCTKCLFPCKTCANQYECSSCVIGYLNTVDKKCRQCQVGTYPENTAGSCQACPSSCVICFSSTYCTICNEGYYLYHNMCISDIRICQTNGYYGIGRVCSLCQQPCKTCSKSATNCTTCLEGYIFFSSLSQCMIQCPTGYYRNSLTSKCDPCAAECTTCVGSAMYCFSCATGFRLYTALMKCVANCPAFTYSEGTFCSTCKYPCLGCTSQTDCTSCISGSLVGTQCLSSCTSGYFSNNLSICQPCSSNCKQCTSSPTNCTQCPSKKFLYQNQCVSACPSRAFAESQSQKCISCMGTCYECSSHVNCTSCSNGLFFYISLMTNYGQCVSTCPNGYYPSQTGSLCLSCKTQCLTCADGSSCLLCNNGKVMHQGKCYDECLSRMYNYQGVCQPCQEPCYNCTDMMTCTSCKDDSFLLVGSAQCIEGPVCPVGYFLLQKEPKCNSQCPANFYHLKSNRTCNAQGCAAEQFKGLDYYCYEQCPNNFIANQLFYCQSCSGSACANGLFFSVKYSIRNDDIVVKIQFTETPKYLLGQPSLQISPNIGYSLQSYLSVGMTDTSSSLVPSVTAGSYVQGSKILQFTLSPTSSIQQTYFKVKFQNPLQYFQNPLQHSSSTFFLKGYDKYNNQELSDLSSLGILALFCSIMGLFKNPYMTDFAQLLWILALNNIHYPFNLRTFLQSTKIASLHGLMGIKQSNMEGSGKFGYLINAGLLQNAFGNIIIVFIGFILVAIGYGVLKFLEWYVEQSQLSGKVPPQEQKFIQKDNQEKPSIPSKQTSLDSSPLPISLCTYNLLSQAYTSFNIKILFLNRFIYFNYMPICLFTFEQIANIDTNSSVNTISFVLAILMVIGIVLYPFAFITDKPKFTFLYGRKILTALSLMLSVNYPAYCIGVMSVCNITAFLLIPAYKLQRWKIETHLHAIGQGLQLVLMILFSIFVMIGQGYRTQFKASFGYVIVIFSVVILFYYFLFALFLFTLWLIKVFCGRDFVTEWIQADKLDDSDGTDSETLNSSMKDQEQKKIQPKTKQGVNWNKIQEVLRQKDEPDEKFIQAQIKDFIQTRPLGISPSKIKFEEQPNQQLFWKYQTNSQQQNREFQKQPPKMLIRCVNQFSDFDQNQSKDPKAN